MEKEIVKPFAAGDKVTVSDSGMSNLVGSYKNTGTVEEPKGMRAIIIHDSNDKDADPANMKRWHKVEDLKKK